MTLGNCQLIPSLSDDNDPHLKSLNTSPNIIAIVPPNHQDSISKVVTRTEGRITKSVNIHSGYPNPLSIEAVERPKPRGLSPVQSIRRQSPSSGNTVEPSSIDGNSSKYDETDDSSFRSDKEMQSPNGQGFHVTVQESVKDLANGTVLQSTAISFTCNTIALIQNSNFHIYSVAAQGNGTPVLKCCGFNNGRFGSTLKTARETFSDSTEHCLTYASATLNDDVLCLICKENCIDIRKS